MAPGRELSGADPVTWSADPGYLVRDCLDVAATVGARRIAGPMLHLDRADLATRSGGASDGQRRARRALEPVADHAADVGVMIGIEPLGRYETSLINTVEQTLEVIDGPSTRPASVWPTTLTTPTWRRRTSPAPSGSPAIA